MFDQLFKKEEELPEYIFSQLNTPMLNYNTYVMSKQEKLLNFLAIFGIGGAVGLVFYSGQFRDAEGAATVATWICDVIIFVLVGLLAWKAFYPVRRRQLMMKRKSELTLQFRSLLETLAVSLSSGMNIPEALQGAYNDLKLEYSQDAYIVREVQEMIDGLQNNIAIEDMVGFLGERSDIEDIKNFGTVFDICYRAGGNMKDVVRRTSDIIGEKIEINNEIETTLSSNKLQFNAMMVIPVILVLMLRFMSSSFAASFATAAGIFAITVAIGMFFGAYKLGQKIMDIK